MNVQTLTSLIFWYRNESETYTKNCEACDKGLKKFCYAAGCIYTISYFTKESLNASLRASVKSAEEAYGLQKALEQQQRLHQEELESLKGIQERTTKELQEMESILIK